MIAVPVAAITSASGVFSCSALEALWEEAGGKAAAAFTAAEIAMAESSGDADAISPTDDFGLWQINSSHGAGHPRPARQRLRPGLAEADEVLSAHHPIPRA